MALAEQAVIAYSKKLLQGERDEIFDEYTVNTDKIKGFIPFLENIIAKLSRISVPIVFYGQTPT